MANCKRMLIDGGGNSGRERIKYIDIAKGITLILMILGHCSLYPILGTAIFIFHMPLFFIACGYLSTLNKEFNVKKKFKKIIIPYIFVFLLSIVPYYIKYDNLDILWIFPLMKTRMLLGIESSFGIGPVWFLPCYFFSNLFVMKCIRFITINKILILSFVLFTLFYIASTLLHGLPFLLYQTSLGSLFIILGYKCKEHDYLSSSIFVIIGIIATLACLFYGSFSMYSVQCKLWIVQIIAGMFCSLVVFEVTKKIGSCTPLEWISRNSLTILCIHSFDWSLGISSYIMELLNINQYLQFFFYCLFIFIVMMVILFIKHSITKGCVYYDAPFLVTILILYCN